MKKRISINTAIARFETLFYSGCKPPSDISLWYVNRYIGIRLKNSRDLKQRRRRRQRERQKTIILISKTLATHVRYKLWYISLSSSARRRREMTTFKVLWRT